MNSAGTMAVSSGIDDVGEVTARNIEKDTTSGSSSDPSLNVEKGEKNYVQEQKELLTATRTTSNSEGEILLLPHTEQFPEDPDAEEETQQFTVRAVLVGCILGGVIAASK